MCACSARLPPLPRPPAHLLAPKYRTGGNDLLSLVVEMLRQWYDPAAREHHLGLVTPASAAERYLGASLNIDRPSGYDHGFAHHRPGDPLLQARRWINDPGVPAGFAEAGMVIEHVMDRLGPGAGGRPFAAGSGSRRRRRRRHGTGARPARSDPHLRRPRPGRVRWERASEPCTRVVRGKLGSRCRARPARRSGRGAGPGCIRPRCPRG